MAVISSNGTGGGTWNAGATWNGGVVPNDTTDDAVIVDGDTVTLSGNDSCKSLTIESGGEFDGAGNMLEIAGKSGTDYAVEFQDGSIAGETGAGTRFDIRTASACNLNLAATGGGTVSDLKIQDASCVATTVLATTLSGDLTITSGELNTGAGLDRPLTVAGNTIVGDGSAAADTATLSLNGSTCSFNEDATTEWSLHIKQGGTLASHSGAVTIGSLTTDNHADCKVTMSSYRTYMQGENSNAGFKIFSNTTFAHNSGRIYFQTTNFMRIYASSQTLYQVYIDNNSASSIGLDIALACESILVRDGATFNTSDKAVTVTGTVDIGEGTSGKIDATGNGAMSFGSLTINSGGEYDATNGTTTLTKDVGGGGSIFNNGGTFNNNDGELLIDASIATYVYYHNTGTGDPHDFTVTCDGAGAEVSLNRNLTVEGDLTINSGTLNTWNHAAAYYNLTVTGNISGNGTLACNTSTVSGNLIYVATVTSSGGSITSSNDLRPTNLTLSGDTTVTAGDQLGGILTVGASNAPTIACKRLYSTFNCTTGNQGQSTITINAAETNTGPSRGLFFYNLTLGTGDFTTTLNGAATITNNLTITTGTLDTGTGLGGFTLTVTGDVDITGTLTGNASAISFGSLTINSEGTYSATSETTTITGNFTDNGTFTHNDGLLHMSNGGQTMTGTAPIGPFYDLKSSGDNNEIRRNMAVENSFVIATGYVRPTVGGADWKIGTTGAAGYISGSVATPIYVYDNEIGTDSFTVSGASAVYPAQLKGNEWAWTYLSQTASLQFSNVDVKFDVNTSTGADNEVKITLLGDCEFDLFQARLELLL